MGLKAAAFVLMFALAAGAARAQAVDPVLAPGGDAAQGEKLFKQKCQTCHNVPDPGSKNAIGPTLYGAYGRIAGKEPTFTYSPGLKASTFVWTAEKLNLWIQKPSSLVPGVKMFLPAVTVAKDRADIIAYLKTHSTNTVAETPAPAAKPKKKPKKA
jgi:cytochrome c